MGYGLLLAFVPAPGIPAGFLDGGETNRHGQKPAERERTIIRGHRGSQALPSGADSQIKLVVADGHGPEQQVTMPTHIFG